MNCAGSQFRDPIGRLDSLLRISGQQPRSRVQSVHLHLELHVSHSIFGGEQLAQLVQPLQGLIRPVSMELAVCLREECVTNETTIVDGRRRIQQLLSRFENLAKLPTQVPERREQRQSIVVSVRRAQARGQRDELIDGRFRFLPSRATSQVSGPHQQHIAKCDVALGPLCHLDRPIEIGIRGAFQAGEADDAGDRCIRLGQFG